MRGRRGGEEEWRRADGGDEDRGWRSRARKG